MGLIYHDHLTPLVKIANVDSGDGEGGKAWGEKSRVIHLVVEKVA